MASHHDPSLYDALTGQLTLPISSSSQSWAPGLYSSSSLLSENDTIVGLDRDKELAALKIEATRDEVSTDPALALEVLQQQRNKAPDGLDGWCLLSKLKPTKAGGYIQLSFKGANKFAMLQEVVLWAGGGKKEEGQDCSHLCCKPFCTTVGHVIAEDSILNQRRKNCVVWVDCPHGGGVCPKKVFVCPHSPPCIKFCEGYDSQADFLEGGLHK